MMHDISMSVAILAPFVALLGAIINGLWGKYLKEPLAGYLATGVMGLAFFFSLLGLRDVYNDVNASIQVNLWNFLQAGDFQVNLGFTVDSLSIIMMLVITGVGLLIHIYSLGYMHGDANYPRYFMALNLFVAAMLILVLADSYLLMFVGWEGVGVCSYLLIGFWYDKRANADAARKAFVTNRVGDVGFLLAMAAMFLAFGSLDIAEVNAGALALADGHGATPAILTLIALFLLIAAAGKSAQLPLHVWLPDAMAGPTPVSALIHAATMVTAGVYVVARSSGIFSMTSLGSSMVAWVGGITAFVAAFIAISQSDIKKILAFSTISQLGFMFAAVGAGAYWVGIFHVFTHAFFKALLFLCSGSVIHALHGEQDVHKMGGLRKHMPITALTALVGTLAISGFPLLAGFFSKDAIMAHVFTSELMAGHGNYALYGLLLITAATTAFYMFRWYWLTFEGEERLSAEAKAHVHESPLSMTAPLMALAGLSMVAGLLGLPEFAFPNVFAPWLEHAVGDYTHFHHLSASLEWALIGISTAVALLGLGIGYAIYGWRKGAPAQEFSQNFADINHASQQGLGFDAGYDNAIIQPVRQIGEDFATIDKGIATGFGALANLRHLGSVLKHLQSGFVRSYAWTMFAGVAILLLFIVIHSMLGGAA